MNDLVVLALDLSSTTIGVCYAGREFETLRLAGDIAQRCRHARALVHGLLLGWPDVDLVALEAPVMSYASATIAQARVSGAVLGLVSELGLCWCEVSPANAKKVLTGTGGARKGQMMAAARLATGCALDEHQSDSYAIWLAARGLKATKEAA